jgi:hypothetical protein
MKRRALIFALPALSSLFSTGLLAPNAWAHHGWSSFDESKPLYLSGKVKAVKWQNPHAEIVITVASDTVLPVDLSQRKPPAQSNPIDGSKVMAQARLPQKRGDWTLELSPMTRIDAWKVPEPKIGDTVAAVAYTFKDEKGDSFARVEYLILGDKLFGLRSMPV